MEAPVIDLAASDAASASKNKEDVGSSLSILIEGHPNTVSPSAARLPKESSAEKAEEQKQTYAGAGEEEGSDADADVDEDADFVEARGTGGGLPSSFMGSVASAPSRSSPGAALTDSVNSEDHSSALAATPGAAVFGTVRPRNAGSPRSASRGTEDSGGSEAGYPALDELIANLVNHDRSTDSGTPQAAQRGNEEPEMARFGILQRSPKTGESGSITLRSERTATFRSNQERPPEVSPEPVIGLGESRSASAVEIRFVEIPGQSLDNFRQFARGLKDNVSREIATSNPFVQALRQHRQQLQAHSVVPDEDVPCSVEQQLATEREALSLLTPVTRQAFPSKVRRQPMTPRCEGENCSVGPYQGCFPELGAGLSGGCCCVADRGVPIPAVGSTRPRKPRLQGFVPATDMEMGAYFTEDECGCAGTDTGHGPVVPLVPLSSRSAGYVSGCSARHGPDDYGYVPWLAPAPDSSRSSVSSVSSGYHARSAWSVRKDTSKSLRGLGTQLVMPTFADAESE